MGRMMDAEDWKGRSFKTGLGQSSPEKGSAKGSVKGGVKGGVKGSVEALVPFLEETAS
jgi:hypothetical protein